MKNKKNNIFGFFQDNMEKCREKRKIMKKSHTLLKKPKIDEKIRKIMFFGFFQENMEKCREKVKNDEKGSNIAKKATFDDK